MKWLYIISLAAVSSCIGNDIVFDTVDPEIRITNPISSLQIGTSYPFEYVFLNNIGEEATPTSITWTSSDESIATIDDTGTVQAHSNGTVSVKAVAMYEDQEASTDLMFEVTREASIRITNPITSLQIGTSYPFEYVFLNNMGETVMPTSITWTSSDESIATVEVTGTTGTVQAHSNGTATIGATATYEDQEASTDLTFEVTSEATIRITNPITSLQIGTSYPFEYVFLNTMGKETTPTSVTWTSSDVSVATIDDTGTVQAHSNGTVSVGAVATYEDQEASTDLTFEVTSEATIRITNPITSLQIGTSYPFEYVFLNTMGKETTPTSVTWTSSDESIATIDDTGTVQAHSNGTATIGATATYEDQEASTDLMFEAFDKVITIINPITSLQVNSSHSFEYVFLNNIGEEATPTSIDWTSSDESVATVDDMGTVQAHTTGTVSIEFTASYEGREASEAVTFDVTTDATIRITNPIASLQVNSSHPFEYVFLNNMGETVMPTSITWTSSDESIATVEGTGTTGTVQAHSNGTVSITVTAMYEGQEASTSLMFDVVGEATISITNPITSLQIGTSYPFKYVFLNNGGEETTPTTITWTSSDESIATIDGTGTVRAHSNGTVSITVTAMYEGQEASAGLTLGVTGEASIRITNPIASLQVNSNYSFEYVFLNNGGEETTPTTITWTSSDVSVATIDGTGTVQAHSNGTVSITVTATYEGQEASAGLTLEVTGEASIRITNPIASLQVNSNYSFEYVFLNNGGEETTPTTITWTSSDVSVATVDGMGTVQALTTGTVSITVMASYESQEASAVVMFEVTEETNAQQRAGSMDPASGYGLRGDFRLFADGEELVLAFEDNYNFSGAPGPYLHLTNNTNSIQGGYEIGLVTVRSGAHEYRIPLTEVSLNQYSVVYYYCKPFRVRLGFGTFDQ